MHNRYVPLALITFAVSLVAVLGVMYALGRTPTNYTSADTIDLTGSWKAESMSAMITDGAIEVDMTTTDTSALYWKGTFAVGNVSVNMNDVEITSQGDTAIMAASLFGSQDDAKTFVYHPKNKTLTFKLTMLGTTQVITLRR